MLYLHVGLHKTATTYFQNEVFPRWTGIVYLRSLSVESYLKADLNRPCVASREGFSGGVVAHCEEKLGFLRRLNSMFPEARILVSFRDHASYLNALYSQYLRYGGTLALPEFFDLENDAGYMKQADLQFRTYVDAIDDFWGRRPFVFLLNELKEDRARLISEMAVYFGVDSGPEELTPGRRNVSLGWPQAEALRRINRWSNTTLHRDGSTRPYRLLRKFNLDPPSLCQLWSRIRPGPPIIPDFMAAAINDYYASDWAYVKACRDKRLECE